jgi:flagellar hook-length control protein FliK
LLQSLLEFASPKIVKTEAADQSPASPDAQALVGTKAGEKVGQAPGRFAKSLEEARRSNARPLVESESGETRVQTGKHTGRDTRIELEQFFAGVTLEELSGLLAQVDPEDLANFSEILGLKSLISDTLISSDSTPAAGDPAAGKLGQVKRKLGELLDRLARSVGAQRVLDAVITDKGLNKARTGPAREVKLAKSSNIDKVGVTGHDGKRAKVIVLDLRKERAEVEQLREGPTIEKAAVTRSDGKAGSAEVLEKDFSVLFRGNYVQRAPAPAAAAAQSVRTQSLPQRFQDRFVPEVVKQTGIILKDGGAGEIRLVLKPENLGSVRIRLSLSESSLEGRIVVDNNSVKDLVESSLDNLKNALRQEGFQTASLEVSVGHRRSWEGAAQNQGEMEAQLSGSWNSSSGEFEKAIPLFLDIKPDYELINLFV